MKYLGKRLSVRNITIMNFRIVIQACLLICILIIPQINPVHPQNKKICYGCNKNITGNYIEAGGKTFHPDHFLCASCGKLINGAYQSKNDKYYHPDCYLLKEGMICAYCSKILDQEYTVSRGKKYHADCYEKFILPKCAICGLPLKDIFRVDIYENKYHAYHDEELKRCNSCGRLICESLTKGGKIYSDGRHICNLCYSTAITNSGRYFDLLKKVMNKLKSFGIHLNEKTIGISGVDRNALKSKSQNYSDNTHGYCDSQTATETMNKKVIKKSISHHIYVLSGMPLVLTESTIAHELMHAWLNENTADNHPEKIREGSCNYVSYIYLINLNLAGVSDFITMLEKDSSPVYGKGFLEIREKFGGKQIMEFLNYLKKYK